MTETNGTIDISALSAPERLLLAQQLLDSVLTDAMPLSPHQMEESSTSCRSHRCWRRDL